MENNVFINANSKEIIKDVLFMETCEADNSAKHKVLGVTACSRVTGCEALNNELRVSVKTVFRIVKCDGENYYSDTVETESLHSVKKDGITPMTHPVLFAVVTDCEKVVTSVIKCKATIEICGWFIKERTLDCLSSSVENAYCKTTPIKVENAVGLAESSLDLTFTDEARMPVAQIIDYCGEVSVSNVYPAGGSYRVEGDVNLRVLMLTDNKQFIMQSFSHQFGTEISDESVNAEQKLDVQGLIKNLKFTVTESDKRIVISDITIKFFGIATQNSEYESVTDIYSVNNELAVTSTREKVSSHFCLRSVREKASASVSVSDANEILGTLCPFVSVGNATYNGGLSVEGIICSTVLYLDENNAANSVDVEIPFMCTVSNDYPCDSLFAPEVCVTSITARLRGGTDVEVMAELLITVRGVQAEELTVISGVEFGEPKETDDFAISLYIVRSGETLWDVAKAMNTQEELLSRQNPDLSFPLKGGEKILLYKDIDFEI